MDAAIITFRCLSILIQLQYELYIYCYVYTHLKDHFLYTDFQYRILAPSTIETRVKVSPMEAAVAEQQ